MKIQLLRLLILPVLLCLSAGCASVKYEKTDPKTGVVTKGSMRSLLSTSAFKGFTIDHGTKTTTTGIAIKEGNTDPNAEAIKALGDVIGNLAEQAAKGAAKGVVPVP